MHKDIILPTPVAETPEPAPAVKKRDLLHRYGHLIAAPEELVNSLGTLAGESVTSVVKPRE